jgi:quercetin dioxygenase-like cupin family protein
MHKDRIRVALWDRAGAVSIEVLRGVLTAEGHQVIQWCSEPWQGAPLHAHIYPETLWLIEGSLTYALPDEQRLIELMPGDRLETPAGIPHAVMAGPDGARYLIATR